MSGHASADGQPVHSDGKTHVRPLKVCCFPLVAQENPVMKHLYGPLAERGAQLFAYDWLWAAFRRADIFHVHWPDAVVMGNSLPKTLIKFASFLISVFVFRMLGTKIVYQVHNIGSHDNNFPHIERWLWGFFLPRVDAFIHMNRASIAQLEDRWPVTAMARHEIVRHPHYRSELTVSSSEREDTRRSFGFDEETHVFLCFGLLRPYKGVEDLIDAFSALGDDNCALIIAGRPFTPGYSESIHQRCASNDRIILMPRFIPDQELERLILACDSVVISHKRVNNSGAALMALSVGRRIVAPALGGIPELGELIGSKWVHLFEALTCDVLSEVVRTQSSIVADMPDMSAFEPSLLADQIESLFYELRGDAVPATVKRT